MATTVTDARISDKGRVELQISASATDVAALLVECDEELARSGGLASDASRDVLAARYGEERLASMTEEWLMDRIGTEMLSASENPLVGFPRFFLVENGYPEGPLVFQAVSYELPRGELSSCKPLEIGPEARIPSKAAVDNAMKSLVRAYGAQRVSDENRPVQLGDIAKVDVEASAGGVPVSTFGKHASSLRIDYGAMPKSFVDQVVGMRPGDEREFSFSVPAIEGLCDEEAYDAKVKVIALYFVDEPKLTPKWIQGKFPGVKSEMELREAMAQNLVQRAGGLPSKEDAIDKALFERLEADIPGEVVDFVVEGVERAELKRVHEQGLGFEEFCAANDTTPDEFRGKLRETAIRDLKLSIALDALWAAKEFTLSEGDLDMFFEQMAPGRGREMRYSYAMAGRLHLAEEVAQRAKARRWLDETAILAE